MLTMYSMNISGILSEISNGTTQKYQLINSTDTFVSSHSLIPDNVLTFGIYWYEVIDKKLLRKKSLEFARKKKSEEA